ncbi:GNAT family N-acetyltransferase [Cellulomonas hominis]|uniref:GNAT family N-acetyltransferase n=1 Tax=Cellulomonas hominis TaxID=156981 RepID=UPI001C1190EC|nr:GNAT family N-acetyltransferase [Cellulomonas hominis]MBU5422134.1 GNAT family N-acetyltransferase [Cellulomonas hominis]
MRIRLIPLPDVTDADVAAWRRLAEDAAEPNLYLDPRFLVPARDRGPDAAAVQVLVVEDAGEWLAALAVTPRAVGGRVALRTTTTGGEFMAVHADRHHPLVRAGRAAEALDALLRGPAAVGLPRLVQLRRFPADGPLADALTAVLGRGPFRLDEYRRDVGAFVHRASVPVEPVTAPVVDPPLPVDHLGPSDRKGLRRRARALARAAGGPLVLHDVSDDPGLEDEFVDLQAAGWKGDPARGGDALRLDPAAERWFRQVVATFRADGDVLALRLEAGGATQYLSITLRSGGIHVGFMDTYSEKHHQLSPGAIGRLAELGHVLAVTDAPHYDPAVGSRYGSSTRIYPDRRTYVDLLVATRGIAAHAAVAAAPLARRWGVFTP